MSYQTLRQEAPVNSESGHAAVTFLIIIIVGALGFLAGRMIPSASLPAPLQTITAAQSAPEVSVPSVPVSAENPVLAKVNGQDITKADVQDTLKNMPENFKQFPDDVLQQIAVDQMIGERVIDAKLSGAGLESDAEVQKELANAQKQIVRSIFIEREVKKAMTEDRLKTAYDDYIKSFPKVEEVKAAHILLSKDDEKKAQALVKELDGGADFAKLAKENSLDGSAENGGDLGYFTNTEVVPEFAKAAFETKPGSYTKKPVKTDFGFHIIKVEDKRVRPAADFETAKPYLEQEISRQLYNEVIAKWREEANIEQFDANGKPIDLSQQQAEGTEPDAGADAGEADAVEPATGTEEEIELEALTPEPEAQPAEDKKASE
ncbi:MAG: peptidylprolyl isomerase [Alphaproteobacteria bacterium]|nr:peptidylprolyl isomerase [Alphaproteobacteria bacterium]MBP7759659.1 peptidylprolyl isomerase [Alphaproteobacteria bacterium]MBP7763009.1 peptidylprolyl isomerase [Alphaproteobacteria bacterium]MBP7904432.1 peptidylprolyl isomerase [Alphaproteobacteria bacterium]